MKIKKYLFLFILIIILTFFIFEYLKKKNKQEYFKNELSNTKNPITIENVIIISCIFGSKFKKVHPCPYKNKGFFFTNNKSLKKEIYDKNWIYVYVDKPLLNDEITSSLQSKYIKFLQFLDDKRFINKLPVFKNKTNKIIYFDHKENVTFQSLKEICALINNNLNKALIIRQSPGNKDTIYKEINAGMGQQRYQKNMNKTKKFVDNLILQNTISEKIVICNTGLLIYINHNKIKSLLDNVYNKCIEHKQPECQIYWAVFAQKFKNQIKQIKWKQIKSINRFTPI